MGIMQYEEWRKINPGQTALDYVFYAEDYDDGFVDRFGKPTAYGEFIFDKYGDADDEQE